KQYLVNRSLAIAIVVLPLLLAGVSQAFAQRSTNPPSNKEVPVRELLKLQGRVVSESTSTRASGDLKLTGYRVEEVRLPRSLTVEVKGQQAVVDRAWRVTVNGGPFPVRAMPAVIWIDDQIVGNGVENETLSQVTAITFDGSLIREGGVVSISYGEDKDARVRISQRIQLKGENQ
ncbi:MAG TPA: hypothetical protein VFS77_02090, partial [Pyrinomonadaceae bacterium]|nr:hypothetical protein [Pyrinomonadaceae bacterium]